MKIHNFRTLIKLKLKTWVDKIKIKTVHRCSVHFLNVKNSINNFVLFFLLKGAHRFRHSPFFSFFLVQRSFRGIERPDLYKFKIKMKLWICIKMGVLQRELKLYKDDLYRKTLLLYENRCLLWIWFHKSLLMIWTTSFYLKKQKMKQNCQKKHNQSLDEA